jgi:NAD-dependent oxidoreductase involved in siderophore biosynthesis
MTTMDAIEVADGDNRTLIDRRHIIEMAEDAHLQLFGRFGASTWASPVTTIVSPTLHIQSNTT